MVVMAGFEMGLMYFLDGPEGAEEEKELGDYLPDRPEGGLEEKERWNIILYGIWLGRVMSVSFFLAERPCCRLSSHESTIRRHECDEDEMIPMHARHR